MANDKFDKDQENKPARAKDKKNLAGEDVEDIDISMHKLCHTCLIRTVYIFASSAYLDPKKV